MTNGSARLFLEITVGKRRTLYLVTPLQPDPRVATRAWSLRNGHLVYHVAIHPEGYYSCSCADSTYRSFGWCKHVRSMAAMGLLPKGKHGRR